MFICWSCNLSFSFKNHIHQHRPKSQSNYICFCWTSPEYSTVPMPNLFFLVIIIIITSMMWTKSLFSLTSQKVTVIHISNLDSLDCSHLILIKKPPPYAHTQRERLRLKEKFTAKLWIIYRIKKTDISFYNTQSTSKLRWFLFLIDFG